MFYNLMYFYKTSSTLGPYKYDLPLPQRLLAISETIRHGHVALPSAVLHDVFVPSLLIDPNNTRWGRERERDRGGERQRMNITHAQRLALQRFRLRHTPPVSKFRKCVYGTLAPSSYYDESHICMRRTFCAAREAVSQKRLRAFTV